MKNLDRFDIRIAKSILAKADRITPKLSDVTTRIEQIEEEYRRKCEEKKAQLEEEKERLLDALGRLEKAMNMICGEALDEVRELIYNDADNVVTDEDTPEDAAEEMPEPEEDDLNVVDEDEDMTELADGDAIGTSPEELVEPMAVDDETLDEYVPEDEAVGVDDDDDIPEDDDDDFPESEDGLLWNVNDFFNN